MVAWNALVLCTALASSGGSITDGTCPVTVNDMGVLVHVPDAGLRTVDGPAVHLAGRLAEWFGLSFSDARGDVRAVGVGNAFDWGGRLLVEPKSFEAAPDRAIAVTRVHDLEITTTFHFDARGHYLLAAVTFTNLGHEYVTNFFYSREWLQPGDLGWTFPDDYTGIPPAPAGICRRLWMLDDIAPGTTVGVGFSFALDAGASASGTVDVPLALWTNSDYPSGLPVGKTNGVSWGDFDGDGFFDIFACRSANLWRNVNGKTWELAADLDAYLPAGYRYGAAFGDYNDDGLPDIGTEPRNLGSETCFHLLQNLGGTLFHDVATDPAIVDAPICQADMETLCWADVNGDGLLDLFLPVYPAHTGGPGNFFLRNLGPIAPGGEYFLTETSAEAGLDNPPSNARPEGAEFVDVDFDGDLDLYSNGALYQNQCRVGVPKFGAMTEAASGIGLSNQLDEGAVLFDYDMDGDYDVFVVYSNGSIGVQIWEAYGDGMFFKADKTIVDSPFIGLDLGMSAEDWDNDGDIDFTTRQVFRRNMLMEEAARHFIVATHDIPSSHLTSATPAWCDWDRDGDLDCALGNWTHEGHFYENTTYGASTPDADRRSVRVRVQRDSQRLDDGLETEFGASVELTLLNVADEHRRIKVVSSSNGYLNQSEYPLHFALPADPVPGDPAEDVRFDVSVDFPHFPSGSLWRVDQHVNPVLGNVNLATLRNREIRVFRSGRVTIDGCEFTPSPARPILMATSNDGLALATATTPLPAPVPAPAPDSYVGLDFDTLGAAAPMRLQEIMLDGQLDAAVTCGGGPSNVTLWDVTNPAAPVIVDGGTFALATSDRNRRSYFRVDLVLAPQRHYRLVGRITAFRASPAASRFQHGDLHVLGGLSFTDDDPCSGKNVVAASADPGNHYLAIRYRESLGSTWLDLANGHAGVCGVPMLYGTGEPVSGHEVTLSLSLSVPHAAAALIVSNDLACVPFYGGTLVPKPDAILAGFTLDESGHIELKGTWPSGIPAAATFYFQAWIRDPAARSGYAASNALAVGG